MLAFFVGFKYVGECKGEGKDESLFGIGIVEIFIVLVLALVVIGPERMPEAARFIGRMVRQVQQLFAEIRSEVKMPEEGADPFVRPDFPEDHK